MALTGVVAYAAPANAQTYGYNNYNNGAPGVANVSVANGNVVIVRGDTGMQVPASVNATVVPGDLVATSSGSLAEVQFDGASALRLANNTQVRFVNLSPGSREVQLGAGTVDIGELQGSNGGAQIDTPSLSVRSNQTGDVRVSVLGNGQTLVTVRNGSATVSYDGSSQTLTPGSTLVAYGPASNPSVSQQGPSGFDQFDQFNISRDQATVTAYNSNPYLSPYLAGYSNLSSCGQWQNVPGYGYSWAPNNQNQNNFAPYQNGQWTFEPGYGYTWVDNSQCGGYTTSHYGTWFNNSNYGGWNWQPPGYQYQNSSSALASAFLPAVVSFFLSGSNGGGFGGGGLGSLLGGLLGFLSSGAGSNAGLGWIPLAPGEQYQPWYGQNYSYPSTALTPVSNVTNIYNYYSNARYSGGISMVPVSAFRSGNFTRVIRLRPQQIRQIVLIRGAVPVVPTRAVLRVSRTTVVAHPIVVARTFSAPVFAAKIAAIRSRVSLAQQQARITSVASAKPRLISAPPRRAVVRPVYRPVTHPPIHVTVIKPVAPTVQGVKVIRAGVKPITKPVGMPAVKAVSRPVAKPMPATKPAITKPVITKPVITKPVITKPVITKPVITKPVITKPVITKPVITKPVITKPVITKPVITKPVITKPVTHPVRPVAKPAAHPAPAAKPAAHPTSKASAKPAATPLPGTIRA